MKSIVRERTITWDAPQATLAQIAGRPQLEWMEAMKRGEIPAPPTAHLMGFDIDTVEEGHVAFTMRAEEWMANPMGVVHGGMTSTILDTVITLAVQSKLPPEKFCTTVDLHVQFVRSAAPDSRVIKAHGYAVHVGRSIGTARGEAHDEDGLLIATATGTFAILTST